MNYTCAVNLDENGDLSEILDDEAIKNLADEVHALSQKLASIQQPADLVLKAAAAVHAEGRLCVGAVELELLGWRDEYLERLAEIQLRRTGLAFSGEDISPIMQ